MNTAPSTLQLRVGGRYLNRRGEVVEITGHSSQPGWPFQSSDGYTYRADGAFGWSSFVDPEDLIAEAPAEQPTPAAPPLQLRIGGRYLSRRGEVVEIIGESELTEWPFLDAERRTYRPDGSFSFIENEPNDSDLIAEAPTEDPRIAELESRIRVLESRIGAAQIAKPALQLRVGGRYRNRLGGVVTIIESPTDRDGLWFLGKDGNITRSYLGCGAWFSTTEPDDRDLVEEVVDEQPAEVDPGPGYRLVVQGELIETGDEWWAAGEWRENGVAGYKYCLGTPLRRRVAPAPEAPARDRIFRSRITEWRVPADGGPTQLYNIATGLHLGESGATLKVLLEASSWIREVVAPAPAPALAPEPPARERVFRDGEAEWRVPADGGPIQLFNARSGEHLGEACQQDLDELIRDPHVQEIIAEEQQPPPTYRLLRPGERIRQGDECLLDVGEPGEPSVWKPEYPPVGQVYEPEVYPPIRRKVAFYEDSPTD